MRASRVLLCVATLLYAGSACAQHARLGLGTPATETQIRGWDIDARPDGSGLPPGQGSAAHGEKIFEAQCSACHGEKGQNPAKGFDRLAGGQGSLTSPRPVQTVGSYWPYATTIFDYVNRTMPFTAPNSLTSDEVYSVVAYLLYINGIVRRDAVMNAQELPKVKMPNADGFIPDGRPDTEDSLCKVDCR
jgi:S-disulfanyl-L-cysteine oxidoreductase SoxD